MKSKPFDAVKFMREIRSKLSKKDIRDPEGHMRELELIHKQYAKLFGYPDMTSKHRSAVNEPKMAYDSRKGKQKVHSSRRLER
jgi:hypothetical protein